jgi:DNA modification methylase
LYFRKGGFKFDFRTGKTKPGVKRKSFGGKLKASKKNTSKISHEMYSEIVTFKLNHKNKIHPTEKPIEFSEMFLQIVGGADKLVIDPFCGSGNLLHYFPNSVGVDVKDWRTLGTDGSI